jgi:hypothetical protein
VRKRSLNYRSVFEIIVLNSLITQKLLYSTGNNVFEDKPQVRCDPEHGGLLGETNFEVVCTGRSHPGPRRVVWSWTHEYSGDVIPPGGSSDDAVSVLDANERIEIFNGEINQHELRPVSSRIKRSIINY